jgi:hypothetical protein
MVQAVILYLSGERTRQQMGRQLPVTIHALQHPRQRILGDVSDYRGSPSSDTPAYHLYTSKEAAERAGGGLTASFFDRLAASRQVEHTYAGRKVRWTDAQIAAAVVYHARGGTPSSTPQLVTPPARFPRGPGAVTPLRAKPGGRYAERTA